MNKIKIAMLLLFLNFNFLSAAGQKKDPISWSVFQGKKSWEDAKNHCSGMGMRLPALSEIKQSIELGTTKEWEKNGSRFWSAERGDSFWSQDPQYGEADTYKSITLTGAEEFHRPESELGVFCINQSTIKLEEGTVKESRVIYPETFTTKTGIKFTKILKKDGKPVYVSDRIRPDQVDSWYFARDYAVKLNQEDNCPDCYRLPYRDEIENLKAEPGKWSDGSAQTSEGLWLQSWSPALFGMTMGNLYLGAYSIDFVHDVVFHPLSWQSYLYPISPDSVYSRGGFWDGGGRVIRSAGRNDFDGLGSVVGFRLVRPLR